MGRTHKFNGSSIQGGTKPAENSKLMQPSSNASLEESSLANDFSMWPEHAELRRCQVS